MQSPPAIASLLVLLLGAGPALVASATINCDETVIIETAADVKEVRDTCRVVGGDLVFGDDFDFDGADVNLDGIEAIRGTLRHNGQYLNCVSLGDCDEEDEKNKFDPSPYHTLSSSTMREINDGIWLWSFDGLARFRMPNLRVVNNSISFMRAAHLVELDVPRLSRLGGLTLESPRLRNLTLPPLEGFEMGSNNYSNPNILRMSDFGYVESLDNIWAGPLNPMIRSKDHGEPGMYEIRAGHNLDRATLGWTNLPWVWLRGYDNELTVTLGGPKTESMVIEELKLYGTSYVKRASTLKNLTVGSYKLDMEASPRSLNLPFDGLKEIDIWGRDSVRSITLPPQAADWDNVSISLTYYGSLDLASEYDDEGEQTWYWPKKLASLQLTTNLTTEFFTSFMEQNTVVSGEFHITDLSGRLDCEVLEDYNNRTEGMTSDFECQSLDNGSGAIRLGQPWQAALMALLAAWVLV